MSNLTPSQKRFSISQRARRKNLEFDLSTLSIRNMFRAKTCPILGIELVHILGKPQGQNPPNMLTIDRIDSSKGYVKGNVMAISEVANRIKSRFENTAHPLHIPGLSVREMRIKVRQEYNRLGGNVK